ncbi:MAG: HDIG domain-containing protein [Ruminococcus sp.]|nr:HDIG domain-containing protein [Ruminococcus sp.]
MLKAIGSRKELTNIVYFCYISDIIDSSEVSELKNITHHISTTRFQHCLNVSYYSYVICKKMHLNARSAARAGLLHDLFYYNRKEYNNAKTKGQISHSLFHAMTAAENAAKLVDINDLERDIIEKHMWPVTHKMPKYKESYVICFVDKYCAVLEFLFTKFSKKAPADANA